MTAGGQTDVTSLEGELQKLGAYFDTLAQIELPASLEEKTLAVDELPAAHAELTKKVNELLDIIGQAQRVPRPELGIETGLDEAITATQEAVERFGKVFGRGLRVFNTAGGIAFAIRRQEGGPGAEVIADEFQWGKVKTTWASGNTVTLYPCADEDGTSPDTGTEITAYIITPYGGTPHDVSITQNDILAYLPFGVNKGLLVNPKIVGVPDGTNDNDLLVWDTTNGWEADLGDEVVVGNKYEVLQVKSDGSGWIVDVVRAT